MSNGELLSYVELAKRFYTDFKDYCDSEIKSDLYQDSDQVNTRYLKANLYSLRDVVFGLRQDGHTKKATRLEEYIENLHKAVEDYDNGNISGTQLIGKASHITGELKALCRPTASEKPEETEQKTELVIEPTGELQKSVTKSKYTPEKIKNMLTSYGKHYEESNDVKYAWNCVADEHDIPSGKAAEMAVRRHQKKNK